MQTKALLEKHNSSLTKLRTVFNDANGNTQMAPQRYVATALMALPRGPSRDYDEIQPNLLLGNKHLAMDETRLKQLKVKHIVNAAMGKHFSQIDVDADTYASLGVNFIGFEMKDVMSYDISQHFHPVADFIENALKSEGKVLVFCQMGASRSASLVIAYLMIKQRLHLNDAVNIVLKKREIFPNNGFIARLCELEEQLFTDKGST